MKQVQLIVLNDFTNDSRVLKTAQSLLKQGYGVEVVALHGEGVPEHETVRGVPVHRIKLTSRSWPKRKAVQLLKYLEFLIRAVRYSKKADMVHCNDLNALPVGVFVKKRFNPHVKIIYDAHEFETETLGLGGVQKRLVKYFERRLIRHADAVLTVSDAIAEAYAQMYAIPKPYLVLNAPPLQKVGRHDLFRETFGIAPSTPIFLYQGRLSRGRGLEALLEAFAPLHHVAIVFMGYGPMQQDIEAAAAEHAAVYFHRAVPPDQLLPYTASADFGLSLIEDRCLSYRYCLPNKMFEYLMVGIPVIVSDLPEMKRVIQTYNVGVVADTGSAAGIRAAVDSAMQLDRVSMQKAINTAAEVFNWQAQERVLLDVYTTLQEPR